MASLSKKSAFGAQLPLAIGTVSVTETNTGPVTWVAPFAGKRGAVSSGLSQQIGVGFPEPNRMQSGPQARSVWAGPDQALVLGVSLDPINGAAMVDHSSAWACCAIAGTDARTVLERLLPIDLRDGQFAKGHAARTLVGHMNCVVMRPEASRYEVMVFRSMASTLVHELDRAMHAVAARARATG